MQNTLLLTLSIFFAIACSAPQDNSAVASLAPTPVAVKPQATPRGDIKPEDLAKLRWIEGEWRGMDGDKPFFERYRLEGTTLVSETIEDETFSKVKESDRFELKDGQFSNGSYLATEINEDSISFAPIEGKARNSFTFKKTSDNSWTATLSWPATADKPARQKVYNMQRAEQKR